MITNSKNETLQILIYKLEVSKVMAKVGGGERCDCPWLQSPMYSNAAEKYYLKCKILVFCALNLLNYSAKQNLFQLTPWSRSDTVHAA
jgi:hypothetical protein